MLKKNAKSIEDRYNLGKHSSRQKKEREKGKRGKDLIKIDNRHLNKVGKIYM